MANFSPISSAVIHLPKNIAKRAINQFNGVCDMKRLLYIFGALVAVLAIVISVVPYLIPSSVYRAQIETQAEAALGRDVALNGDARLSIIPSISARVGGVTVANPSGFSAANMIEAGELRARVKFFPLLAGRVEIAEISLVDANVSLERLSDGTANWVFSEDTAQQEPTTGNSASLDAGVDRARLVNSSLSFIDAVTGSEYVLSELSARASMKALDEPLTFVGDGVLNGEAFSLDLDLTSVAALTAGETATADLTLKTDLGEVAFDGSFVMSDIPTLNGAFDMSSERLNDVVNLVDIDLGMDLASFGEINASGNVSGPVDALLIEFDRASQKSDLMEATYAGQLNLASPVPLDGTFSLKTPNIANVTSTLGLDLPITLTPIGALDLAGSIKGSFAAPSITFDRLSQSSELMDTDYSGAILIGDEVGFDGNLTSSISDAGRLFTQMGIDAGPVSVLEKVEFSGGLQGPLSALGVQDAELSHDGALLSLDYKGDLSLGVDGNLGGALSASSLDLRGLLAALEVELAPGDTLKSFSVDGSLSGKPTNFSVSELALKIDEVSGTGRAGLNTTGDVPRLDIALQMPSLDLTPFLGESSSETSPSTAQTGWSTTPLALEGLRAVNADIALKTGELRIGNVDLKDADLAATLTDGDLEADIAGVKAFGGNWSGDLELDASRATPTLAIDMQGSNVAMQSVMSTFANLSTVSGVGNMTFKANSSGNSLDALVRGLNGELKTDLADGAVKGFNIAQIVRSLESIQTALTSGSLGFALSPEAQTDFTQFDGALTITNGVANIDIMRALNPAVLLDGKGKIDLANQTIDISITPSVDTRGVGELDMLKLNGEPFPLPFRIAGNWLAPSVSIDNAAIAQQLRQRAVGELGRRISDELGGDLGGLVDGVLGRTPANDDDATEKEESSDQEEDTEAQPEPEPETVEDAMEDLAEDALRDLFGRRQ